MNIKIIAIALLGIIITITTTEKLVLSIDESHSSQLFHEPVRQLIRLNYNLRSTVSTAVSGTTVYNGHIEFDKN